MLDLLGFNEKYYICAQFSFDNFASGSWPKDLYEFAVAISNKFKVKITHFTYSYYRDSILKDKCFKFNERNLDHYLRFSRQKTLYYAAFFAVPNHQSYSSNPSFVVKCSNPEPHQPYCDLYLHLQPEKFTAGTFADWKSYFRELNDTAAKFGTVKYALLQPLERRKVPLLYFNGIPGRMIWRREDAEKERVMNWLDQQGNYKKKIRDVFMINKLNQWQYNKDSAFLERIKGIVGEDNLEMQPDKSVILTLPYHSLDWRRHVRDIEKLRERLRFLFKEAGLMM